MQEMTARIERLVAELCAIQRDLNQTLMDAAGDSTADFHLDKHVGSEALRDLKSVVDQVRHFLWFYLQLASAGTESGERTRQLLRQIARTPGSMTKVAPLTFLERLNALTEYALVHHAEDPGSKPN